MKNIVVLDDSLTIHKIVEYSIDPDKYKLYKIFTIEDFNSKLKDINTHLLLLDNKLDGLNVKDFCKMLKDKNRNIKIILLVGAFEKLTQHDLTLLNVDDFINKPFNSKVLSEKIETLMGGIPSYMEKGFEESHDKVREIDYEKLLEELEPIALKREEEDKKLNIDNSDKNKEFAFDNEHLDNIEDGDDIKAMRYSFKSLEDIEDLKITLEKKLKKDLESIDFHKIGGSLIEEYIKIKLENINLESMVGTFIEKRINEVLSIKLEKAVDEILNNIITSVVPNIAEKLIQDEIEKIKKGEN
jgi:DNA-binding response OmpR family regulator